MNVIDGQAGLICYASLIFYSLTIDNILNIIVLIILAGISINLVLGENGLFNKAKSTATETAKARFVEDAGFAYSEAYIEKTEKSDSNNITIGDVVSKLKSSYGYTNDQIKTLSSGVSGITLSETEVTLEPGETEDVIVTLENGTYYAFIEGLYYPITLSNKGITLGEGVANLQTGDEETLNAEATLGSEKVEVTVVGTTIKITAKEGQKQAGEATVTVTYGESITKTITVKIKVVPKQGDVLPLGNVDVKVGDSQIKLAHGWKYFYNDEEKDKVWLIYDGILKYAELQVGGTIRQSYDGYNAVYSFSSSYDLISYLNGTGSYAKQWDYIKSGIKNALNSKLSVKNITVEDSEIEVKGSPDAVLFQKAYDQMYPDEKFEVQNNGTGYQYRFGETGDFKDEVNVPNYSNKTLFFIGSNFIGSRYWLASPTGQSAYGVCNVNINTFTCDGYSNATTGARPVVSIPKTAFDKLVN